jgi:transposase
MEMKQAGLSIQAISELTGCDRKTVRKHLLKPEAVPSYGPRAARPSKLDAHKPYLADRLKAGVWNAQVLLREIRPRGYQGGCTILKDWMQPQRAAGMATAVRRFETPPGKHYGESRVMVRGGGDLGVLAHNRRRDQAAALHKTLQGFEPLDEA